MGGRAAGPSLEGAISVALGALRFYFPFFPVRTNAAAFRGRSV